MLRPRNICRALLLTIAAGTSAVFAAQWTDPAGDVTLPNSDIIGGSASISGRMVDLRVQFLAAPFPTTNTQSVTWNFDIDKNASTTNPDLGSTPGVDLYLLVDGPVGQFPQAFGIGGINRCLNGSIDPATNTLRFLFPASLLPGVSSFDYAVYSSFGGSFGRNEVAPDVVDFASPGSFFQSDSEAPQPFNGTPLCTLVEQPVLIDVRPGRATNTINVNAGGRVPVAILSHGGFDAVADVDTSTLQFGWSGQEPSVVDCSGKQNDVDGDGLVDLVCDFSIKLLGLQPGDTVGVLRGQKFDGTLIRGSDQVTIMGGKH